MPHALSERQKEYLEFIREYIRDNEKSPQLNEIAEYFGVKPPTAHKILETLQFKGFIYFVRSSESGFFIRLVERAGMREVVMHVPIAGKVGRLGEVINFPKDLGGFDDFFFGAQPYTTFALSLSEDLSDERMRRGDILVFDRSKKPQAGDICIIPIGKRLFLARIAGKTIDKDIHSFETSIRFPIPADLTDPEVEQMLNYYPLAYDENTEDQFNAIAEEERWPEAPLPMSFVVATALHMWRQLGGEE